MKNASRFFIGLSLSIQLLCYGCGGSFEVEMNEAQQAMDQAKSFHADELAASNWKEALQTWDQAQAAAKAGKPAKSLFLNAKARFKKAGAIAKAYGETIAKEVAEMQLTLVENLSKVKAASITGNPRAKSRNQVNLICAEVESGTETINKMVAQGDYLKAKILAKDMQNKIYNAGLILEGKKTI